MPIREMLARVGDKWSILILGVLGDQRLRFGALNRAVPGTAGLAAKRTEVTCS